MCNEQMQSSVPYMFRVPESRRHVLTVRMRSAWYTVICINLY